MFRRRVRVIALLAVACPLMAQRQGGELRLQVSDPTGAPLPASVDLVGQATQVHKQFALGADGLQTISALLFGVYRLRVEREGFQGITALVEIRSEIPLSYKVTLGVAPIETTIDVSDTATLLNPDRTGASEQIGSETLGTA